MNQLFVVRYEVTGDQSTKLDAVILAADDEFEARAKAAEILSSGGLNSLQIHGVENCRYILAEAKVLSVFSHQQAA
jgi:hypothetical protein